MVGNPELVQAIRDAIKEQKRSLREVSGAIGHHTNWLGRVLRTPRYKWGNEDLLALEQALDRPFRTLVDSEDDDSVVFIPVVTEGSASLKGGVIIEQVPFERAKLPASGIQHVHAVRARGACLEPIIEDGDTAIVDTSLTAVPGRIIALMLEGELHLKGYRMRGVRHYAVSNEGEITIEPHQIEGVVIAVNKADPRFPPR